MRWYDFSVYMRLFSKPRPSRLFYYTSITMLGSSPRWYSTLYPRPYAFLVRAICNVYSLLFRFLWSKYPMNVFLKRRRLQKKWFLTPPRLRFTPGLYRFIWLRRTRVACLTKRALLRQNVITRFISYLTSGHYCKLLSFFFLQNIFFFTKYFFFYKIFFFINGLLVQRLTILYCVGDILSFLLTYRFLIFILYTFYRAIGIGTIVRRRPSAPFIVNRFTQFTYWPLLVFFIQCERDWWAGLFFLVQICDTRLHLSLEAWGW